MLPKNKSSLERKFKPECRASPFTRPPGDSTRHTSMSSGPFKTGVMLPAVGTRTLPRFGKAPKPTTPKVLRHQEGDSAASSSRDRYSSSSVDPPTVAEDAKVFIGKAV